MRGQGSVLTGTKLVCMFPADDLPKKPEQPSLPTAGTGTEDKKDEGEAKDVPTTPSVVETAEAPAPKENSNLKPLKSLVDKKCTRSPANIIAAAAELTSFSALLSESGLSEDLQDVSAKMTIFAPTDEAFEDLGVTIEDLATKTDMVSALIGYHIVPRHLTPNALAIPGKIETVSGDDLFGGSSKEIEGLGSSAKIIGSAVKVCGSLVYLVDEVLLPAATLEKIGQSKKNGPITGSGPQEPERAECKKEFDAFFAISADEDLSMLTQ